MNNPTLKLCRRVSDAAVTPPLRTMREFAEQEIVIPTGPYQGHHYSVSRQPYAGLWFAEVEKGWKRLVATGPTQSGKTLQALVIPIMYHLFEVGEDVILAAPTMAIARDKWMRDILPVIRNSRYRELLPTSGAGSKGGNAEIEFIEFANGRVLRVMTGGGDDKSRSNFTARVVCITETDGMDDPSETSREADPIEQLEGRTQAFGDRARIYMECTVSVEEGRTWREYTSGTESKIVVRCQHCRRHVTPEREHLHGWQSTEDEMAAIASAAFACPECGAQWTEADRKAANHDCLLVHKGQEVTPDGVVTGQPPRTRTMGFRWNACNNLLVTTGDIGAREWKAQRASDEENSEKALNQFWWAKPYRPPTISLTALDPMVIVKRTTQDPRGRVPGGCSRITVGVDIGKYLAHWTAIAWGPHASPHVIEYGRIEVPTAELGEERAILSALRQYRDDVIAKGWPGAGSTFKPELVAVDAGWNQDIVLAFCAESPGFIATKGFGVKVIKTQRRVGTKTEAGWEIVWAPSGAGYELLRHPAQRAKLLDVDADRAKTWLHARIQTPMGQPGALTLYQSTAVNDHLGLAKHLVSEKKVEDFEAGKGVVTRWEQIHRNNHLLDSTALACVAGHVVGERLIGEAKAEPAPKQQQQQQPEAGWNPNPYQGKW